MTVIDTHTHFYDPARPQGVPWPTEDDPVLYRTVLPEHYESLAAPELVRGTVVVEASEWLEDNQWILDLAAENPFIVGFVGNLDVADPNFPANLKRFTANPLFRGVRLRTLRGVSVGSNGFLMNMERLAAADLSLDLLVNADRLPDVSALAANVPTLRIVLDHIAHVRIDGQTPDVHWTDEMRRAAEHPNVFVKVSGLVEATGRTPAPGDVAFYTPTLDFLWETFGEERLFYGSNWPVSERFADYGTVQRIAAEYFRPKGEAVMEKVFSTNSRAVYKWIGRLHERDYSY